MHADLINNLNTEYMNPVLAGLLALSLLAAPNCFAQTVVTNFGGLSATINLSYPSIDVNVADPFGNSLGKVNASDQNIVIQLATGTSVGSHGVANFGVETTLGEMKSASIGPLQLKATGNSALYAEAGYVIDAQAMVYAKLSTNQLTANVSGPGAEGTLTAHGYGYGAGYRLSLAHGTFLQGELMQVVYSDVISNSGLVFKPTNTTAMVGVGIKF
jgi:hypothetical protein